MTSPAVLVGGHQGGRWSRRRSLWLVATVAFLGVGASAVHLLGGDSTSHPTASGVQVAAGSTTGTTSTQAPGPPKPSPGALPPVPFHAELVGTIAERAATSGRVTIDLQMRTVAADPAELSVELVGRPADGGVALESSSVEFGPVSDPARYRGQVIALDDEQFVSQVWSGRTNRLDLDVILHIDPASGSVRGTVDASSADQQWGANEEGNG